MMGPTRSLCFPCSSLLVLLAVQPWLCPAPAVPGQLMASPAKPHDSQTLWGQCPVSESTISHLDSFIQITDVSHETSTEQNTGALRVDTLCTHREIHSVGSILRPTHAGPQTEGVPATTLVTRPPSPSAVPVVVAISCTHRDLPHHWWPPPP